MNNGFGKRKTNGHEPKEVNIQLVLEIIAAVVVIIILAVLFGTAWGNTEALLLGGMLGNPFRTTRKMKVPPHQRRGHTERATLRFFRILIQLVVLAVLVTALYQYVSP